MTQISMDEKFKRAAEVICKQGMVQFPVSDTAITIVLNADNVAQRDESACLGCGVCSHFCPEEAISLQEGLRRVFIMPPRLRKT